MENILKDTFPWWLLPVILALGLLVAYIERRIDDYTYVRKYIRRRKKIKEFLNKNKN